MNNSNSDGLSRPVTQKQFDSALNQVEKIKKGKNSSTKNNGVINAERSTVTQDDPVIRIYNDAFNKDFIVKVGFYKLKPCVENENYFIMLTQGGKVSAKVSATQVNHSSFCKDEIKCVKVEAIENTYLKFYYKDLDIALVGYLHILEPEAASSP
ncbi:MAG: hypothetical protein WC197_05960 [Candidatus Gastranaerophilaceae bacterium]|jgi:cell division protein YceG involved in septum cleavage